MTQGITHTQPKPGCEAKIATCCECPDTGIEGCFLYTGESHRTQGSRVSEIHPNLASLFPAIRILGWKDTGPNRVYTFKPKI